MTDWNQKSKNPGIFSTAYQGTITQTKYGQIRSQSLPQRLQVILDVLRTKSEGLVVEIGVLGGYTLLTLYDECLKRKLKIYGIDPFETIAVYNGVEGEKLQNQELIAEVANDQKAHRTNLEQIIAKHKLQIELIVGTSWENFEQFSDNSIDLLHIDGDHSYDGVLKDITLFWPKIKVGGHVIFDDANWSSVGQAINKFKTEHKAAVVERSQFCKLVMRKSEVDD